MSQNERNEKTVKLCTARDLVEYEMVKDALKEAGLDCMEVLHTDSALDGIYVPSKGYADIHVFESDREKACEILASIRQEAKEKETEDEAEESGGEE